MGYPVQPCSLCYMSAYKIFSNKAYFIFVTHSASGLHNVEEEEYIYNWDFVCVYEYIHTKSKYNKIYVEILD